MEILFQFWRLRSLPRREAKVVDGRLVFPEIPAILSGWVVYQENNVVFIVHLARKAGHEVEASEELGLPNNFAKYLSRSDAEWRSEYLIKLEMADSRIVQAEKQAWQDAWAVVSRTAAS